MKPAKDVLLFLLACGSSVVASPLHQRQNGSLMVYGFDALEAKIDLSWTPCFNTFTCAKLRVPLDYENEAAGTTHVSFIKWTAESNSTSTNATTQDILFNPGGPGSSGISFVEQALPVLQQIVGTAYNIIGFDPRGVNNSGPNLSCFPGGEHGASRLYGNPAILDVNDTKSYSEVYAKAAAFGEFCTKAHSGPNGTAQYANTVATANDMRHYTELLAKSKGEDPQKSQLWYYGISYGSAPGTTFASLFPDRVGRVIVDGTLDVENYYQGKWELPDADKAFRSFFQTCYDAGQNGTCAFWATSPAAIEARYNAVVANLARNPIPIVLDTPAIATVSDLKQLIAQAAYDPIIIFQIVAQVLAELERRDASTLASFMSLGRRTGECTPGPDAYDNEPQLFIACTDANGRFNLSTYDEWVDYANGFVKQSQFLGESWAAYTSVQCHKLNIKAPKSQVFEGSPGANLTSNPLLFISSAVAPVTPLRAAQKLVKRFRGAGLLVQDNIGHSSTSAPSKCSAEVKQRYLKTGEVPGKEKHCKADRVPFQSLFGMESGASLSLLKKRYLFGV